MESAVSFEIAKQVLFSFAVILVAGAISGFLSQKINVPDVARYLVTGIILGPEVTGLLRIPAELLPAPRR